MKINQQTMIDYLNDCLDDPVTQQWLDQRSKAADELREAFGIERDQTLYFPTERSRKALDELWGRLIADSAHPDNGCEHLLARPLQPTAIVPEEAIRMCLDCAAEYTWQGVLGTEHACPGCGGVEILVGEIWADLLQRGPYIALLLMCYPCRQLLLYEREPLGPRWLQHAVADALPALPPRRPTRASATAQTKRTRKPQPKLNWSPGGGTE